MGFISGVITIKTAYFIGMQNIDNTNSTAYGKLNSICNHKDKFAKKSIKKKPINLKSLL